MYTRFGDELGDDLRFVILSIGVAMSLATLIVPVIIFANHRLYATVATCPLVLFWTIITGVGANPHSLDRYPGADFKSYLPLGAGSYMIFFLPVVLLSVAPAKAVARRLIFLALGLVLLIALNELSKLGLDVTAPKHG
jgi:hypothetical protein